MEAMEVNLRKWRKSKKNFNYLTKIVRAYIKLQALKNSRQIFEVDDRKARIYGEYQKRLDEAAD